MRKLKITKVAVCFLLCLCTVSLSSCRISNGTYRSTYKAKKLPPGQAKKIYGGKSAKSYAPGQNR